MLDQVLAYRTSIARLQLLGLPPAQPTRPSVTDDSKAIRAAFVQRNGSAPLENTIFVPAVRPEVICVVPSPTTPTVTVRGIRIRSPIGRDEDLGLGTREHLVESPHELGVTVSDERVRHDSHVVEISRLRCAPAGSPTTSWNGPLSQ
jgi:hypothetical protein